MFKMFKSVQHTHITNITITNSTDLEMTYFDFQVL